MNEEKKVPRKLSLEDKLHERLLSAEVELKKGQKQINQLQQLLVNNQRKVIQLQAIIVTIQDLLKKEK